MLLHDNVGSAELSTMVDLNTIMDNEWARTNAMDFVESVELVSTKFEQPEESIDDYEHEFWNNNSQWPEATIKVTVTDKAWCSHIKEKDSWDTAAFDPAMGYNSCEPILFEKDDSFVLETDYKNPEGFIAFQKEKAIDSDVPKELDETVYLPKFHIPAYEPVEKIMPDNIDPVKLKDWIGKPLIWSFYDSISVGFLAEINNGRFRLIHKEDFSSSESHAEADDLDWISLIAYKKGQKRQMQVLNESE